MTPKEKAESLINRYNLVILDTALGGSNQRVKKCVLIAIDEIENSIDWHKYETPNDELNYWNEVKKELEKL